MTENCTTQHGYGETGNAGCGQMPHTGTDTGLVAGGGVLLIVIGVALWKAVKEWTG